MQLHFHKPQCRQSFLNTIQTSNLNIYTAQLVTPIISSLTHTLFSQFLIDVSASDIPVQSVWFHSFTARWMAAFLDYDTIGSVYSATLCFAE